MCVLSGRSPSIYNLLVEEIPQLQAGPGVFPPTQYLYLNSISWGSASTERKEILRDWIAGGGRVCAYMSSSLIRSLLETYGIYCGTLSSQPGTDLAMRKISLANCVAGGVEDLNPSVDSYVDMAKTNVALSLISGTDTHSGWSYLCAIEYGKGLIVCSGIRDVFAMPSQWVDALDGPSGDDGARFMMNFRTWMAQGDTDFWCGVCSSAIAPSWNFCPYCGHRLP